MQQNTGIALNEDDLQAVTGGINDGVAIGGAAAAGVGGGAVGAVAGAAATRLKMQKGVNNKIQQYKVDYKSDKLGLRTNSRGVRQAIHNLTKAASRA
jgi:hypothetical protein